MVDHHMVFISLWEVADNQQLLNLSLQRLNNSTGASDASCAVSTAASTSSAGSHRKPRHQDNSPDYDELVLRPLVQSIRNWLSANASWLLIVLTIDVMNDAYCNSKRRSLQNAGYGKNLVSVRKPNCLIWHENIER